MRGVDLSVSRGEVVGLLGPNGAGKTTLIRIIATIIDADAGSFSVCGVDAATDPASVRAQHRPRGPVRVRRPTAHRAGEPRADRDPLRHRPGRQRQPRRRAADLARPRARRRPAGLDLLRRHAQTARPRRHPHRRALAPAPRRTDGRPRSPEPERALGAHRSDRGSRDLRAPDQPAPRRGRAARRPRRRAARRRRSSPTITHGCCSGASAGRSSTSAPRQPRSGRRARPRGLRSRSAGRPGMRRGSPRPPVPPCPARSRPRNDSSTPRIEPTELALRVPSLEEAFLALTGETADSRPIRRRARAPRPGRIDETGGDPIGRPATSPR